MGLILVWALAQGGDYHEVAYPPSARPGELVFGVTYTLWVPRGADAIRGVIVHQHGCGSGACKGGATAAYDLHWQALARKWNCALLGPSYAQEDGQNCRLWCDPRNGSEKTFLRALKDLSEKAGRPEIATAPWCLWGHSGGGVWSSIMTGLHPERVVGAWLRSGTAFGTERVELPRPERAAEVFRVPIVANPGFKEKGDARFNGAWTGSVAMVKAFRAEGAPIAFAPDPRTGHECGDSRYLAIRWFDACLDLRLPGTPGAPLRPIDLAAGRLPPAVDGLDAGWLPAAAADAWGEYVKTGWVGDASPPPAPTAVALRTSADGPPELVWEAEADLESGLMGFLIQADGREIGRVPAKPAGKFGKPLFQAMSYHDTPEKPLPAMRYLLPGPIGGELRVVALNGAGLASAPSAPALR